MGNYNVNAKTGQLKWFDQTWVNTFFNIRPAILDFKLFVKHKYMFYGIVKCEVERLQYMFYIISIKIALNVKWRTDDTGGKY